MDLSCHVLFPEHPPPIKVVQWKSKTEYIEHIFDKSTDVLYKDDTILTTLLKILAKLDIKTETIVPYVWSDEPLRFKIIKNPWIKYNVNPFLANISDIPPLPDVQQFSDKIMNYKELNFITYSDFIKYTNKPQIISYYFPNKKDGFTASELQSVSYQNKLLAKLWSTPESVHKTMFQQSSCTFVRAFFKLTSLTELPNFKHLFNHIHASIEIPFIQFCDDMNHIYYKVYKNHSIPEENFKNWSAMENIKNQSSITLYSFIKEKGLSFAKFLLDDKQNIQVIYFLDPAENISFQKIQHHLTHFLEQITKQWKIKFNITIDRLAVKTNIFVKNIGLLDLSTYIAKLLPIFKISNTKNRISKNILDFQYVRVPKYGQTINIVDFIKSKIQFEVPLVDIIEELSEYGITEANVREYYEQIQRENDLPTDKKIKRNYKDLGLIMHLSVISLGLQIYIDNATSIEEIQNALFWTRAAVYQYQQTLQEKTSQVIIPEPFRREEAEEEEEYSKPIIIPPRDIKSSSSSSSSLSLGGAIGKKHQRYFKNMLEKLDPDIFSKSENYARKCQISDLRQPVGMTKEQKEKIDKLGYSDGYDNYLEYGSDPNKTNVYMCPKIYCPDAQIPLSYEKFKALGEKCPDPNDEPILLYTTSSWYNDPLRKHYVGFLKEKGYNNVKLPCCFKTPQDKKTKLKSIDEEPESKEPEDTYIIDKLKQLEPNRYGTIPVSLHEFLYPNVPYTLCRNTVKASECLLRRGIVQSEDSLMESIAYLLDFENKDKLIQHIYKTLDPFTFITLENGKIYSYFLPEKPIMVTKNKAVLDNLKIWFDKFPNYVTLFDLAELYEYLDLNKIEKAPLAIQFKVARQLQIYESYYNYLRYLKDTELKNPYLLFDLVHFLGSVLIVWNRDSQNIATVRCPYVTKNIKWYMGVSYILVMQQENYYEPLILVDANKNITQKVSFTKFEKLLDLLKSCPAMLKNEDNVVQEIKSLSIWIEYILSDSKPFKINRLVVDYEDRIIGFFLKNNIYIGIPIPLSMFSVKTLSHLISPKQILYWEDIQSKSFDIKVNKADLNLLKVKLLKLGYSYNIGTIKEETIDKITSLYTVPKVIYKAPPKLPLQLYDSFIQMSDLIEQDNQKWYQNKKTIITKLIEQYDIIVKPLLTKPKIKQLKVLRDYFAYLQQPSRTAVILEEIPYDDYKLLEKSLETLLLDKPYYHTDNQIYEGHRKREWIFTQKALYDKDIEFIIKPTTIKRPVAEPKVKEELITNVKIDKKQKLPAMINKDKLELKPIPSKWRSKFWLDYKIGILESYNKQTFYHLLQWLAEKQAIQFDMDDIKLYVRKQVNLMLENPDTYETLLEDLSMRKAWNTVLQRNYRTIKELIEIGFANKEISELQQSWLEISKSDQLWIQDIDLFHISKLLNISFFILQKGKDIQTARGNIDELVSASKFISQVKNWEMAPILLLFKQSTEDKTHYTYSVIVSSDTNGYYEQSLLLPDEIRSIIGKHLE